MTEWLLIYDLKHWCKRCLTFISISSVFIESEWYGFVWAKYFMKIPFIILIRFFLLLMLPRNIIETNNSGGFFLRIELYSLPILCKDYSMNKSLTVDVQKYNLAKRNCKITAKPQIISSVRTLTTYIIVIGSKAHLFQ